MKISVAEAWRDVPGETNYEVSDLGRVRNKKTGRVLMERKTGHIELSGKSYRYGRLVLSAFGVKPFRSSDVAIQINPEEGYKLSNLRWGTKQEAAVDWTKRDQIVQLAASGASIREIQSRLGVDYETVKRAVPALQSRKVGRPWGEEKKQQVGEMVMAGASLNEITRTLGVDHRTIKKHFPGAGMVRGSKEHKEATRLGKQMREIEGKNYL